MNSLLATFTNLDHEFYNILALAATCAQVHLPRARAEQILYPHFIASYFAGRDFYSELERCEQLFWNLTGESTQSFQQIVHDVTPYMLMYTHRRSFRVCDNRFKLDLRILLVIIWLRMYPEVAVLSGLFMICPSSVEREVRFLLPVLWNYFKEFVRWPTAEQWLEMAHHWEMFPGAVAVIDGTRHRIQRPQTEPQQSFYCGHTRCHNFSTQIVMNNQGNIVFIQSGFIGHNNDSGQLQLMPSIGVGGKLHLPPSLYILADKGYPCVYPLITPWRCVAGDPSKQLFNRDFARVRTRVEHCIRRVKEYGAVQQLWRYERWMFPIVVELCVPGSKAYQIFSCDPLNFYLCILLLQKSFCVLIK